MVKYDLCNGKHFHEIAFFCYVRTYLPTILAIFLLCNSFPRFFASQEFGIGTVVGNVELSSDPVQLVQVTMKGVLSRKFLTAKLTSGVNTSLLAVFVLDVPTQAHSVEILLNTEFKYSRA